MNLKDRLQRMLQIVEESERVGALSDLERDILLNDLREAYAELKFGKTENDDFSVVPTTPTEEIKSEPEPAVEPEEESEPEVEADDEPEVEVEIIFDEEENDEEDPAVAEPAVAEPVVAEPVVAEPVVAETPNTPIVEENLSTLNSQFSTPKRSPLLSLYEDEPMPILGEQFHEKPSVADTIACPKGVAESAPVTSLRDAIGVADKFMLIRELFAGDAVAYDSAIEALDKQASFDDCIIFIAEHYAWAPNSQATKLVMDLLQRKYN
ncbi:MAG: hypothetical protein J6J57_03940 [Alistipes sp.]|nr:hypothetical protein [Alistipes sp.]